MPKKNFLALIFLISTITTFAQRAGTLDTTFNHTGIVYNTIAGDSIDEGLSMALQSDGKIVVVGYISKAPQLSLNCSAVLRYNANVSLDTTFNRTGYFYMPSDTNYTSYLDAVAIQSNGKIVALGLDNDTSFILMRLNVNGTLDTTFANKGINNASFKNIGEIQNPALILQPDGKIIAAGSFYIGLSSPVFGLTRYDSTGILDNTFGINGISTVSLGLYSSLYSVATQSNDKIIASGFFLTNYSFLHTRLGLARFNTNGSLDSFFGTNGIDTSNINNYFQGAVYTVGIQSNDKIVVGGVIHKHYSMDTLSADSISLARYNSNGGFDTTFGDNGVVISPMLGAVYSLLIQPDGKIIAAGLDFSSSYGFRLLRLNNNGTQDTSFGNDGQISTLIVPNTYSSVQSIALQRDGKIIAAGFTADNLNLQGNYFALTRYDNYISAGILNLSSIPTSLLTYPNPVHDIETLDYTLTNDETLSIVLYDISGRVAKNFINNEDMLSGEHKQQLNFENLTAGTYILTISNADSKTESLKIVKQ